MPARLAATATEGGCAETLPVTALRGAGPTVAARLAELGAERFCARGEADERTGLTEVEPWIASLWTALAAK